MLMTLPKVRDNTYHLSSSGKHTNLTGINKLTKKKKKEKDYD